MIDLPSVFVGAVFAFAVSFGADRLWLWFGRSPRERTEKRLQRWKRRAERQFN